MIKPALFVLAILLTARVAVAQEPYGRYMVPPTPVTGLPPWIYKSDPKTDAAKVRAARLYVQAIEQVELARADLDAADTSKAGSDPMMKKAMQQKLTRANRRLASAREAFKRATELDATSADYWGMLGYTCCIVGDRDCAYSAYEKSLAINPNHYATREYQAEAYLKDGRIHDARAELEWLKSNGNKTTLETRNLTAAIERWTKENPEGVKMR